MYQCKKAGMACFSVPDGRRQSVYRETALTTNACRYLSPVVLVVEDRDQKILGDVSQPRVSV
ncbi:hypothetical protein GZ77_18940 [Endozoicomonas montiporae]|uniref:Uncharacterized protein n=2 Tax=Endozoicomonas montiporae TaxID=1027273 RepID=A0A081N2B0_9GAMM|nr:hypothetical protein EZMO1_4543 [Endozoicomonas montiporae CL-33]KEQ12583.1 hypothetical protein GZ77_18940 [Endozoicomonas montiporae]